MLKDENEWIHGYWESRCEFCNVKSKIDGFSHLVYFIGNNCVCPLTFLSVSYVYNH